jgi:hypothetical protein
VTLDCPNNRYVNDEKICQALAAMWAQIGVKVAVNAMPRATYFPKLEKTDTSMYMLGWGGATTDAIFVLQPVLSTYNGKGDGDYNYGRYSNAKLDALTAKIKTNMKEEERLGDIHEALLAHNAEVNTIPAAPAGDSLGDAEQRHRGAPRRQQRHSVLGDDPVAAGASTGSIQLAIAAAISARISASLRPVRAGTWNEWSGLVELRQLRTGAQADDKGSQEREFRELVAGPLQEEHRNRDVGKVSAALVRRLARRMQRKADEDESAHTRQRRCGLRGRRHAAAERPAACEQGQFGQEPRGSGDRAANGACATLGESGRFEPFSM